jgi:hypothetical protein
MSWCLHTPEDEAISLFAGLLANPDMRLSHHYQHDQTHRVSDDQVSCVNCASSSVYHCVPACTQPHTPGFVKGKTLTTHFDTRFFCCSIP